MSGKRHHVIAGAVVISAVLHALLVLLLPARQQDLPVTASPTPVLNLIMRSNDHKVPLQPTPEQPAAHQPPLEEPPAVAESADPLPANPAAPSAPPQPRMPAARQPPTIVQADKPKPPATILKLDSLKLDQQEDIHAAARSAFGHIGCTERERASPMIDCTEDTFVHTRPMAELIASLLPRETTPPNVQAQLDRLDIIMAQAENLTLLDADDPAQAALLREQQRALRDEILRIDAQLASVNLLRLIPMAKKLVEGLENTRD